MKKLFSLMLVALMALAVVAGCSADASPGEEETLVYNNGTFTGYSNFSRGYVKVSVTMENDEITNVDIVEFDGDGVEKEYETYGNDNFPVGLLEDAHTALAEAIVEANSVDVDDYSGATSTSRKVKEAVAQALERALVDQEEGLIDGTYFGRTETNERNTYQGAVVTVSGGVITEVEVYDAVLDEETGRFVAKDEDYDYAEYHEAVEQVSAAIVEANSADVDTYAGATSSSAGFIAAVEQALEKAAR